jgi:hypothetical protein
MPLSYSDPVVRSQETVISGQNVSGQANLNTGERPLNPVHDDRATRISIIFGTEPGFFSTP